jgi:acyl-CoA thioester hydrolase
VTIEAPLALHQESVRPDWIDYNGHLNVAYYLVPFDHATDAFFDYLGVGEAYRRETDYATFTLEGHVTYEREVLEGAPLRITTQLLGFDAKRIHYIHHMYHAEEGFLSATNELMSLHVDLNIRRAAAMPDYLQARLQEIYQAHAKLPQPPQAGRSISMSGKRTG